MGVSGMGANPDAAIMNGPVRGKQRIETIDILRGFALFGVLTFNMIGFSGQSLRFDAWTNRLDQMVYIFIQFFVQAKFYSLFSFLFGWGMAVQMMRGEESGRDYLPRYVRRILLLLLIGAIHGILIWDGDILTDYALLGLVLILFRKRSDRFLLTSVVMCLCISTALNAPWPWMEAFRGDYAAFTKPLRTLLPGERGVLTDSYLAVTRDRLQSWLTSLVSLIYYFGNIFAMFLLGFYFGRKRIFHDIAAHLRLFRVLCAAGFVIGVPLNYIFTRTWVDPGWITGPYARMISNGARTFGAPALTMFYISGLVLLLQKTSLYNRLQPLANVGKMALTNYLSHSIVFTLMFYGYGLGWYGRFGPFTGMLITVLAYLIQVRFSRWWFDRYQFGPTEWVWRTLTYGRRQPLREGVTYADLEERHKKLDSDIRLRQQKERRRMIGIWLLLAMWAVGLFLWNRKLEEQRDVISAVSAALRSRESRQVQAATGDQDEEVDARISMLDRLTPVAREPGQLASAGDVYGLAAAFDGELALDQIAYFSSEEFAGREAGSAGGEAAALALAEAFSQLGLQPGGDLEGGYIQRFPVHRVSLDETPELVIVSPGGERYDDYLHLVDFAALVGGYAGPGSAEGDVVWGNNCMLEDFTGMDVVGEVIFCREVEGVQASRNALEFGAAALLLLPGSDAPSLESALPRQEIWVPEPMPTLRVSPTVAAALLEGSGYSLDELSLQFEPVELSTSARVMVATETGRSSVRDGAIGRNVIGILPGRSTASRDEVIVIGASFDSLGASPEGVIYPGANHRASGLAALLEMARTWQVEGFVPLRTVVFVAWDGSQQNHAGQAFFLDNGLFPLHHIVHYIHVGAVGSSAEAGYYMPRVDEQLLAIASSLAADIPEGTGDLDELAGFIAADVSAIGFEGRSPFNEVPLQGLPQDTIDNIDLDRLTSHGRIIETVLLILAESEPAIDSLLMERGMAVEDGERQAFLASSSHACRSLDQAWFDDAVRYNPVDVRWTIDPVVVFEESARGQVEARMAYLDEDGELESLTLRQEAHFIRTETGWLWDGPDHRSLEQGSFTLHYPSSIEEEAGYLLSMLVSDYETMARRINLPTSPAVDFMFFSNAGELRASVGYSLSRSETLHVETGLVRMVYRDGLEETADWERMLSSVMLTEAGVSAAAAQWLYEGLAQHFLVEEEPLRWQPSLLRELRGLNVAEEEMPVDDFGWARLEYLRKHYGDATVGVLIRALGRACERGMCEDASGWALALQTTVGLDAATFDQLWTQHWVRWLEEQQTRLDEVLSARQEAVLSGDRGAFLLTVDPRVPMLRLEEAAWFDALMEHDIERFNLSGEILAVAEDGAISARVTTDYALGDVDHRGAAAAVPLTLTFRPFQGSLVWSGSPFESLQSGRIRVLYPQGAETIAEEVAALASDQMTILTVELGLTPAPITLKIFGEPAGMRISIDLSRPLSEQEAVWSSSNSIKLALVGGGLSEDIITSLTRAMMHSLMSQAGIDSTWVEHACAVLLSSELDQRASEQRAMSSLNAVARAIRSGSLPDLRDLPQAYDLVGEENGMVMAQAWSALEFLVQRSDELTLRVVVDRLRSGMSMEELVEAYAGMSISEFQRTWQEAIGNGIANPAWVTTAMAFDAERAMEMVQTLSSPQYEGRRMGSAGGAEAARYIASQFADLGLLPAGDGTGERLGELQEGDEALQQYFQVFPVDVVELEEAPGFALLAADGSLLERFTYQAQFQLVPILLDGAEQVTGELVWVLGDYEPGLELGGRIVLRDPVLSTAEEIALAEAHGAGGLILLSPRESASDAGGKTVLLAEDMQPSGIPVFEVPSDVFEHLLEGGGLTRISAYETPPAVRLGIYAAMTLRQRLYERLPVPNVLGMLPGSDPAHRDEVVILSAHFDHVGDDPGVRLCEIDVDGAERCERVPGLPYSGANDNASGVAVLLEIARTWRETDYRPGRTVLFAAWNGQEFGQVGSTYYTENPVLSLEETVGVFILDAVGAGEGYYLEASGLLSQDGSLLYTMQTVEDQVDGRLHLTYDPEGEGSAHDQREHFYRIVDRTGLRALSDHLPFRERGVPSLLIRWRGANETNQPDGDAEDVDPAWLNYAGRMVSLAVMVLAR